ncbi:uncharacterized protein G2W53_014406 [Senna tora]|uniref:Uncharacterized protein n=1 Tax=Senna tora TaxID=362788 RepID=A0A834WT74_9FABA|nr:uncharacterized protein G2W53_014406 [Senna tora]
MRQKTRCTSESNTSVRVVLAKRSGFDAPIGVVLAWEEQGSCLNIFRMSNLGRILETLTNYEAKDLLRKSRKPSRITRQKTCCATESNESVRVVFANRSGFDASIGVILAWEERGSSLNIFRMTNRVGSKKPSQITRQKTCCASESNTSVRIVFANRSGFDAPIGVVLAWEERGSCINVFRTTDRGRISETFTNYEAKDLLRKQKTCCASESNTSVRIVFANRSGFDAPIGVVLAWEDRGLCLNIFRTTNRGRISETFTNYELKDLFSSESKTSVRVVFTNRSGFDAPIGVVLAWEERGSGINIIRMKNRGRIKETFTNYEAKDFLRKNLHNLRGKRHVARVSETRRFALYLQTGVVLMLQLEFSWHGRSVDLVLTYSGRQIAVGSQKPSRITRQKTCSASESNIVDMAWEERGSSINIYRMKNRGRISETFTNYEAKDLLRNGFDSPIGVVLAWEGRGSCLNIFRTTNRGQISETFTSYEAQDLLRRQKTCCASESNTSVRIVFANRSGFDAPIGVVLAWEDRGLCLNIFRTTNRGWISETFTNYEAKDLFASESNTSVRVLFANRSGFVSPIGVILAWEERGSCLNIFRKTNCCRISETFTNYEAKDLVRK